MKEQIHQYGERKVKENNGWSCIPAKAHRERKCLLMEQCAIAPASSNPKWLLVYSLYLCYLEHDRSTASLGNYHKNSLLLQTRGRTKDLNDRKGETAVRVDRFFHQHIMTHLWAWVKMIMTSLTVMTPSSSVCNYLTVCLSTLFNSLSLSVPYFTFDARSLWIILVPRSLACQRFAWLI